MDTVTDELVKDTAAALRGEANRGIAPHNLNPIANQMEAIWDAIKRQDQSAVNKIGASLLQNRMQMPIPESAIVWEAQAVVDQLLSHAQLRPPFSQ